jgi:hypothetical protein
MWNIIFMKKRTVQTVQDFLYLSCKALAKALREIDILEKYGFTLTEPHVKHITRSYGSCALDHR